MRVRQRIYAAFFYGFLLQVRQFGIESGKTKIKLPFTIYDALGHAYNKPLTPHYL